MITNKSNSLCKSHGGVADERVLLQNYVIAKLNRKDLEDRYYSIWNSNIALKKRLNSQNEKIKFLNTKLSRITSQHKKDSIITHRCCTDYEDIIEEQVYRIHQLQKFNFDLLEKIEMLEFQISEQKTSSLYEKNGPFINSSEDGNEKLINEELMYIDSPKSIIKSNDIDNETHSGNIRLLEPINETSIESMEEKIAHLEKEIDMIKKENTKSNGNTGNKTLLIEVESNKAHGSKDLEIIKDDRVQTFIDINMKSDTLDENEILNKKIMDQEFKILQLEQKIERDKMKYDILDMVQSRLNTLNEKVNMENVVEIQEIQENVSFPEQKLLEKELCEAQLSIESYKMVNNQLHAQILEMQSKLDLLLLEKVHVTDKKIENETLSDNIKSHSSKSSSANSNSIINSKNTIKRKESVQEDAVKVDSNETAVQNLNPSQLFNESDNLIENNNVDNQMKNETIINDVESEKLVEEYKNSDNEKGHTSKEHSNKKNLDANNSDDDSNLNSDVHMNNLTYDISTNGSSDFSNTPVESLSEGYLSDGEVRKDHILNAPYKNKNSPLSLTSNMKKNTNNNFKEFDTSTSMKHTIDEISKEMEKCKQLLSPEYAKKLSKDEMWSIEKTEHPNQLSNNLNATFTLHITSVELTEEAMLTLQDNLYFLTWKFYNEIVAYTPLRHSQISEFNFCASYSIIMNEEFRSYLLSKNMEIEIHQVIGEISKLLACCEVKLSDVFDNINKKIDYELNLKSNSTSTEENENVNYGCIRCWCKLLWQSKV